MTTKTAVKTKITIETPKPGTLLEGEIIELKPGEVFVDLSPFGTGIIYGKEFNEARSIIRNLKLGDKIVAKIIDLENENGFIELSAKEAGEEQTWESLKAKKTSGEIISGRVVEANRGGLIIDIGGQRAFMPVSQLSAQHYPRVEGGDKSKILAELNKFVGQTMEVKIIDLDPNENKLIVSEKEVKSSEYAEALKKYKVNDIVEAEITGVVDFGAFAKLANEELEGLIHISELDYKLIENPAEIVQIGQKIKAKIIDINESGRICLSIKALKNDPWLDMIYKKGDIAEGTVTKLNPFGAFVQLDKDIHGLCHISEFGNETKMKEMLQVGKKYNFKIISISAKEHRMAVSLSSE